MIKAIIREVLMLPTQVSPAITASHPLPLTKDDTATTEQKTRTSGLIPSKSRPAQEPSNRNLCKHKHPSAAPLHKRAKTTHSFSEQSIHMAKEFLAPLLESDLCVLRYAIKIMHHGSDCLSSDVACESLRRVDGLGVREREGQG